MLRVGAWNIQGLAKITGKLPIIEREIDKYEQQRVGIAEKHLLETEHFKTSNNNHIYFSGGDEQTFRCVAILITQQLKKIM